MITLQQIEVFRAVLSEGSVTAAGRRLNLSQPSVSRILSDLEAIVGFALFRRRSRGMAPTAEALFFQREVETIYTALKSLEDAAREIAHGRRGQLSLVVNHAIALDLAPRALGRMNLARRNVSVTCQCKSSDWIIDFARSGTIRTGVANIERMPKGMHTRMTSATPHLCLLPAGDPLAVARGPLDLAALRGRRLVGLTGSVADALTLRGIPGANEPGFTSEISLGAVTMAAMLGAVPVVDAFTAQFCAAHLPAVVRPLPELPPYLLAIFGPAGAQLSGLDRELQGLLEDEIRRTEAWVEGL
ncbi:MAG: LysR family transcriptional regulator [Rhodobacteraceae bacterium]|nr:LysR family transcriptional regulator [Paracoccaceae bacterium]